MDLLLDVEELIDEEPEKKANPYNEKPLHENLESNESDLRKWKISKESVNGTIQLINKAKGTLKNFEMRNGHEADVNNQWIYTDVEIVPSGIRKAHFTNVQRWEETQSKEDDDIEFDESEFYDSEFYVEFDDSEFDDSQWDNSEWDHSEWNSFNWEDSELDDSKLEDSKLDNSELDDSEYWDEDLVLSAINYPYGPEVTLMPKVSKLANQINPDANKYEQWLVSELDDGWMEITHLESGKILKLCSEMVIDAKGTISQRQQLTIGNCNNADLELPRFRVN